MASLSMALIIEAMAPLLLFVLMATPTSGSNLGVNYGMVADNLPPASEVVELYKSNKIGRMRLFDPNPAALQALQGSDIQLVLGVPNQDIQNLAADKKAAADWVKTNILAYPNITIRYIGVGNEMIPNDAASQFILGAIMNIHAALKSALPGNKIKVSTVVSQGVLGQSYPPSAGAFSSASSQFLGPIIKFLDEKKAPLLVNIYPYFAYIEDPNSIDIKYALFTSPETVVQDGEHAYQNLFDAITDSIYSALDKMGGANIKVVVTESGWPSDGGVPAATISNAQTYNSNLIKHLKEGGTPKRPNVPIEAYIFAMFNENQKQPPGTENHFGLFYPDKQPVYPIKFH